MVKPANGSLAHAHSYHMATICVGSHMPTDKYYRSSRGLRKNQGDHLDRGGGDLEPR